MIVRVWRGEVAVDRVGDYERFVTGRVFPPLKDILGFQGATVLRRDLNDGQVEFLVITRWDSLDAIRGFTGDDVERAVVEPEARAMLSSFDDVARHFEIAYDSE